MVMKILETYQSTAGSLDYNERKVAAGTAAVIGVRNIPGTDMLSIRSVFERLERRNIRSRDVSFQMAMNPNEKNPSERYTDGEAMRMAEEVMGRLGYGGQPFVVFRHNDISREHFHVISIRVNEQGRKIRDRQEQNRLQQIMKDIRRDFHFEIGEGERKRSKARRSTDPTARPERYSPDGGALVAQFGNAFAGCLGYRFSTVAQFEALMTDLGFRVEMRHMEGKDYVAFQGLDKQGKPVTEMVDSRELGVGYTRQLAEHMIGCEDYVRDMRPERFRIRNNALYCAKLAGDENHFRALMAKKGIGVHFAKTDEGRIFGVIFVDHTSRAVFKGSEIDRSITARMFQELKDTGAWKEPGGDHLKMDRYLVPTNTLGDGVFASQHEAEDRLDASDLGNGHQSGKERGHGLVDEILHELGRSHGGPGKGKNPMQKKRKKRRVSYL